MLINLSNHSIAKWSDFQIKCANDLFGEVIDMQFPQIPPEFDENQVKELAKKYSITITEKFAEYHKLNPKANSGNAIHIMGEFTFCFALLQLMKNSEYKFYASTTQRVVKDIGNNEKISEFKFVRFRKYMI